MRSSMLATAVRGVSHGGCSPGLGCRVPMNAPQAHAFTIFWPRTLLILIGEKQCAPSSQYVQGPSAMRRAVAASTPNPVTSGSAMVIGASSPRRREFPLEPRLDAFPELLSDPVRYGSPRVFPNQEDQSKEVIVRWVVVVRVPASPAGSENDVVQVAERSALSFRGGE